MLPATVWNPQSVTSWSGNKWEPLFLPIVSGETSDSIAHAATNAETNEETHFGANTTAISQNNPATDRGTNTVPDIKAHQGTNQFTYRGTNLTSHSETYQGADISTYTTTISKTVQSTDKLPNSNADAHPN